MLTEYGEVRHFLELYKLIINNAFSAYILIIVLLFCIMHTILPISLQQTNVKIKYIFLVRLFCCFCLVKTTNTKVIYMYVGLSVQTELRCMYIGHSVQLCSDGGRPNDLHRGRTTDLLLPCRIASSYVRRTDVNMVRTHSYEGKL